MKKYQLIFVVFVILLNITYNLSAQIADDTIIPLKEVLIESKLPYYNLSPKICKLDIEQTAIRDIGDFLRTTPNVSGVRKGGAAIDPVVRGFRASQINVVLNDGIKIEGGCPSRMDPVTSHIEAEEIEKMEVIKGPYVLKYGSVLGGTINIQTIKAQPFDKFEIHAKALYGFETNWNGQREHLSLYGGNNSIFFNLAGGYKNYGNYHDGNDKMIKSSFKKYNYNGSIGYSPKENHTIYLSYMEDHGRDVSYSALPMDEVSDDTYITSFNYQATNLSEKYKSLTIGAYNSEVKHVMDNSKRANYATMQAKTMVDATNRGGRMELSYLQSKSLLINVGVDYEDIYKDGTKSMTMKMTMDTLTTISTKKTNVWLQSKIQNTGLFTELKKNIRNFNFILSLRGDYNYASSADTLKIIRDDISYFQNNSSKYFNLSGSIGATTELSKSFSISIALGRGVRSPNMLERYIKFMTVGFDNYDYIGNPLLKPETNYQADLTFLYKNEILGNMYLNGFYSYVSDYISGKKLPPSIANPSTQGALGVKQFTNIDLAFFRGFEFGFNSIENYKLGVSLVAAYTQAFAVTITKYIITNNQVTGEEEIKNDPLPEIPPFESTISIYYKIFNNKLVPKLSFRLVASQKSVSDAFYEMETSGFGLLNFSVNYKPLKYFNITVGANNILDRPYYEHLNRKIIGSTEKLYEPGRVFFINFIVNI